MTFWYFGFTNTNLLTNVPGGFAGWVVGIAGAVGEGRPATGAAAPPEDSVVRDAGVGTLASAVEGQALSAGDAVRERDEVEGAGNGVRSRDVDGPGHRRTNDLVPGAEQAEEPEEA